MDTVRKSSVLSAAASRTLGKDDPDFWKRRDSWSAKDKHRAPTSDSPAIISGMLPTVSGSGVVFTVHVEFCVVCLKQWTRTMVKAKVE